MEIKRSRIGEILLAEQEKAGAAVEGVSSGNGEVASKGAC
jgi:hypothetical protein